MPPTCLCAHRHHDVAAGDAIAPVTGASSVTLSAMHVRREITSVSSKIALAVEGTTDDRG